MFFFWAEEFVPPFPGKETAVKKEGERAPHNTRSRVSAARARGGENEAGVRDLPPTPRADDGPAGPDHAERDDSATTRFRIIFSPTICRGTLPPFFLLCGVGGERRRTVGNRVVF